jgi:hypothetical protein
LGIAFADCPVPRDATFTVPIVIKSEHYNYHQYKYQNLAGVVEEPTPNIIFHLKIKGAFQKQIRWRLVILCSSA